jgi:Lamin Tail Domain
VIFGVIGVIFGGLEFASSECLLGLGSCPPDPPEVRIDAASSLFNAPGYDDPADEYVCLVNVDEGDVNLVGWQLRKEEGDVVNTLPSLVLAPGASIRVHPGEGRNSRQDLYGDSGSPVWRNDRDTAMLVDAQGGEIDSAPYREPDDGQVAGPCGR